jgi:hypothetical protein
LNSQQPLKNSPTLVGPMALYSLVSRNVFNPNSTGDFFQSLLPFFEPYIASRSGEIFDLDGFVDYAKSEIFMPINTEVAEIFAKKMVDIKWIERDVSSDEGVIYRVIHDKTPLSYETTDIDKDLTYIIGDIIQFARQKFLIEMNRERLELDTRLLSFLVRTASSRESDLLELVPQSDDFSIERADYIFSRYVADTERRSPFIFELISKITGVALLAEALSEIRRPSLKHSKRNTELTVFLDGPLAMNYLGVSGVNAQKSATFTIDHLKALGVTVSVLKQSCDEIKANLQGLFLTPAIQRHGLTNTALIQREVTEDQCRMIMNSPEHSLKSINNINVLPHTPATFRQNDNYCPDNMIGALIDAMPSNNETARRRDGEALGIVMRRRAGHSTDQLFGAKFIFLTSNDAVVSRANKLLRDSGLLSTDLGTYGPALHQRTMAGLLFANVGLAERIEVSRGTVLDACARTAMLRPKLLEQMKEQLKGVASIHNNDILEALLLQPRGGEIVMDFTIGAAHTVSARNREELIEVLKRGLTDALTIKHQQELDEVAAKAKAEDNKRVEEIEERDRALVDINRSLKHLQADFNDSEVRFERIAIAVANAEARNVTTIEVRVTIALAILSIVVFCAPLIWTTGKIYTIAAWSAAFLSACGFFALIVNRQFMYLDGYLQSLMERKINTALQQQGLEEYAGRLQIVYRPRSVALRKVG